MDADPDTPGVGSKIFTHQENTFYGMMDAKRDLAATKLRKSK